MLVQLAIRDIVLIDRLDLDFSRGLTVLTGETGAGKSILLDAFSLALGARGDGTLVRAGAAQGQVTASFELARDHPARAVAAAAEIDVEDGLILRHVDSFGVWAWSRQALGLPGALLGWTPMLHRKVSDSALEGLRAYIGTRR